MLIAAVPDSHFICLFHLKLQHIDAVRLVYLHRGTGLKRITVLVIDRVAENIVGIVVQCQNERSQHMNKDKAMQMLKAKLYLMKQQEQADKVSGIRGEIKEIGFGSQIRSYVMQPYTLVKDHRTNMEISNVNGVLDGNLDPFINAYLSAPKNPEE